MEEYLAKLTPILENKYVSPVITIFIVLYSGLIGPQLPDFMKNLFNNQIFRILVLALIVYKGERDPTMALMIAIAFTFTLNYITERETKEMVTEKFTR